MSQTLIIKADRIYIDKIISMLKEFPVENIELIQNDSNDSKKSKAFGILNNSVKDPVKWQQEIREANEREIYSPL
ncbi:MAG: hypothetical protein JXQ76_01190 [Campylobacterales bacterium]|nr:hypothetical protein [Campylobacterales bacterium]